MDSKYPPIDPGMACMFAGAAVVSLVSNLVIRRYVNSKLGSNEVDGKGSEQESKQDGTDKSEKKNVLEKNRVIPMWLGILLEIVPLTIFIVLLIYICCANRNEDQNKTTINTKTYN